MNADRVIQNLAASLGQKITQLEISVAVLQAQIEERDEKIAALQAQIDTEKGDA